MNNKNKIIKNHDLFRSEPLGNVPNKKIQYSIIKQTNIGDDAIVRTTNTSLEKGTVVGGL